MHSRELGVGYERAMGRKRSRAFSSSQSSIVSKLLKFIPIEFAGSGQSDPYNPGDFAYETPNVAKYLIQYFFSALRLERRFIF
jgi:hypothetical protein